MSERIAAEFCRVTRGDISRIIQKRIQEVDTKLLLHSIQKTTAFESLLSRRFTGYYEALLNMLIATGKRPILLIIYLQTLKIPMIYLLPTYKNFPM